MAEDEDLGSHDRQFGTSFFSKADQDITENRDFLAQKKLEDALRDAKPSALKAGGPLFGSRVQRPPRTEDEIRRTDFGNGQIVRQPPQPDFPEETATTTRQVTATSVPNITFIVSDASVATGSPPVVSNKVKVADGKINGEFPAGMGFNNYVIDLSDPADSLIYAGLTFNPTTLAITSRFLGVSGSGDFPESRAESATAGFLYWLLAFTYFDANGRFKIVNVRVGDISFAFSYGVGNAATPCLLPVDSAPGYIDLDFL